MKKILLFPLKVIAFPFTFILGKVLSIGNLKDIKAALETPEIQRRVLFTLGMVLVFRILAVVPLPGVDPNVYQDAINANTGGFFSNLLTLATGGQIDTPSLAVIGLGSYINASIIIQLLTSVIPKLEELKKEGQRGQKVLTQITRLLTVPLAALQGFVIYTVINQNSTGIPGSEIYDEAGNVIGVSTIQDMVAGMNSFEVAVMILAIVAGSVILMWLSELITESGIGNGSSIIIMTGILAIIPALFITDFNESFTFLREQLSQGNFDALYSQSMIFVYAFVIGVIVIFAAITFMNEAVRKVQIQYARRVRGIDATQSSYLPLKVNQAGVMPIIFASSMLTFPTLLAQFASSATDSGSTFNNISQDILSLPIFNFGSLEYMGLYFVLIILFTFFYTFIQMKPEDTADNLKKSGGFIPGIRPGKSTTKYITSIMIRLTTVGALFVAFVAVAPNLIRLTDQGANLVVLTGLGGTSLLIIVGVVLNTFRQIRSLTVTKSYEMYR